MTHLEYTWWHNERRKGKEKSNRKGIYHDRENRRKKENNMYTIMITLTLMNCIQNDAGHNTGEYKIDFCFWEFKTWINISQTFIHRYLNEDFQRDVRNLLKLSYGWRWKNYKLIIDIENNFVLDFFKFMAKDCEVTLHHFYWLFPIQKVFVVFLTSKKNPVWIIHI